jgi:hypothetical protein
MCPSRRWKVIGVALGEKESWLAWWIGGLSGIDVNPVDVREKLMGVDEDVGGTGSARSSTVTIQ